MPGGPGLSVADMEIDLLSLFESNSSLTAFATIGLGFLIGRFKVAGAPLGSTAGVLLTGLVLGHLGLVSNARAGDIGFAIFMYSVGLSAGPRFFGVLRGSTLKYISLALVAAGSSLFLARFLSQVWEFDSSLSAGLVAGALTSTPTLAAAQTAVQDGIASLPPGVGPDAAVENIAVAYALTYVFGMVGLILFVGVMPKLFRVDLHREAMQAAHGLGILPNGGRAAPAAPIIQAYAVENEAMIGRSLRELDLGVKHRILVARIKRGDELIDPDAASTLQPGDLVSLLAPFEVQQRLPEMFGPRVQDKDLLESKIEVAEVVVNRADAANKTLGELGLLGDRGLWTSRLTRSQIDMPLNRETAIQRGDILFLIGLHGPLQRAAQEVGVIEAEVQETDLPTFALGIVVGFLLGEVNVRFGNAVLTLGTAGGLLISGILLGYLRSINPTFGRVPTAARLVMQELGLLFFMASVGLRAGSSIVAALLSVGPTLVAAGAVLTLVTPLVTYALGSFVLKMNPAILIGAVCGAMTSTPALAIVTKRAGSEVPALGYAGAYPFANIVLTFVGTIIMRG